MNRALRILPWVSVVVGPVALFAPMLARGEALFWGTPMLQFVPWRVFALRSLREGILPLWNPGLGMGAPLVANYQSALFYLPNALLALTGPAWGHGWLVLFHLVWTGAGMILLARRLGMGPLGQCVSAVALSLSSAWVGRAGFLSINAAAAWMPWVVAAADRLGREGASGRPRWPTLGYLSLCLAFQWLAGHAQTAWYSLLLAAAWAGWRATGGGGGWRSLLRVGAWFGLGAAIAFTLSAVQLLPTAEYLAVSARETGVSEALALTYSFWPWRILGLLLPGLFGSPVTGDYWGYGNFWEDAIYVGVLPLMLALSAIAASLRGRGGPLGLGRFLLGVIAVSLVLALGKNTPVFPFLFRHVPTFDLFQAPTRWNLLLVFCLAVLAGLGAERWATPQGRTLYWTRLGTAGAAALGLSAWLFGPRLLAVEPSLTRAFTFAGLWLVIAGGLSLARPRQPGLAWITVVGLVVVADLTWANWGLNPSAPASLYRGRSALASSVPGDHRLHMPAELTQALTYQRFFRFDTFDPGVDWRQVRDVGLPDTTLLDGVPSADNFDPLLPDRYVAWMDQLESATPEMRARLLGLMDVGWSAAEEDGEVVYQPIEGVARVRLYSGALAVQDGQAALDVVTASGFDPTQVLVLEGDPERISSVTGGEGEARIADVSNPNRVGIEVEAPDGAWLLLADVWYPGWQARIDGQRTLLYRADFLFRAVWAPPGDHTVVFEYVPWTFRLGGVVSAIAWAALLFSVRRWPRA